MSWSVAIKSESGKPMEIVVRDDQAEGIVTVVPAGMDDNIRRAVIRGAQQVCNDLNRLARVRPPAMAERKTPGSTFLPVKWTGDHGEGHNGRRYHIWSESYAGRHGDRQHHGQLYTPGRGESMSLRTGDKDWTNVTDHYSRAERARAAVERYEIEQLKKEYPELLTVTTKEWTIGGVARYDAGWEYRTGVSPSHLRTGMTYETRAEARDVAWLSIIESRKPC